MKKNLLFLFALICSVTLFTACGDDDGPEYIQDGEFDGVYLGTLDVDAAGMIKTDDIPQKVYMTKTGENQIKMELKNFSFQTLNLGTIAVENIAVVKSGANCTFTGSQKITLSVGECDVTVKGSIEGGKLDMDIDVLAAGVLNVKVDFEGTKMAADKSSEAEIKTFKVKVGEQDIDATIGADNKITFIVPEGLESLKFVPTITISDKATITPASGVEQDFASPVTYTVTSEDGIVKTKYIVSIAGKESNFNFDEWEAFESTTPAGTIERYEVPIGQYGTSNIGVLFINGLLAQLQLPACEYAVMPVEGKDGKAAQLKTLHTAIVVKEQAINAEFGLPYVTAGSLFTGVFNTDMVNPLNSTKFGIPFGREPITFTGWYKYTPGPVYYDNKNEVVANKTDKCSIYAVLYEEHLDGNNKNIPLNGDFKDPERYISSSSRIVMKAALADGTAKSDWTQFTIPFEMKVGKAYDTTKKYYLAIVCSSSFEGDYYKGAPESTLLVDDFNIIAK